MVRAKPELYLTLSNTVDADTSPLSELITPECYIVSAPPPLVTPALSRSSSLSTNRSQSDSDSELDDDDDVALGNDAAIWTPDQDEALLSV